MTKSIRQVQAKMDEMQNNLEELYAQKNQTDSTSVKNEIDKAIKDQLNQLNKLALDKDRLELEEAKLNLPGVHIAQTTVRGFNFNTAIRSFIENKRVEGDLAYLDAQGREEAKAMGVSLSDNPNSLVLPQSVMNTITTTTSSNGGGNAIETNLMGYIEQLREQSALSRLGATFMTGLEGNIEFSAELSTATAQWLTETGEITKSTPTFEKRSLSPKRLGVFVELSNKWIKQASPEFNNYISTQLLNAVAEKIDNAGLWGSETNGPVGVGTTSGITQLYAGDAGASDNANGAALIRADLINMMKTLATNNALIGNVGFATNAAVRASLQEMPIISGSDQFVWNADQPNRLMGYNAEISQHIPSNLAKGAADDLSAIIMGNFADVLVGMWGGMELLIDPFTQATTGKTRLVINHYADVLVRRPESFVIIKDVVA